MCIQAVLRKVQFVEQLLESWVGAQGIPCLPGRQANNSFVVLLDRSIQVPERFIRFFEQFIHERHPDAQIISAYLSTKWIALSATSA